MEHAATESLKELAAKRLAELREMERAPEHSRNTEGVSGRCSTVPSPLGVEHGTPTPSNVVSIATLTREDLKYPLGFVEQQLPTLSPKCREYFDYWLDLIKSEGYPSDQAMRAAFYRTIRLPRGEY